MPDEYVVKIGAIYLVSVPAVGRGSGYGFSSDRADARLYDLTRAEQIAGDLIAKGFAMDPADVSIENAR